MKPLLPRAMMGSGVGLPLGGLIAFVYGMSRAVCISGGIGCYSLPIWPAVVAGVALTAFGAGFLSAGLVVRGQWLGG